MQISDLKAWPLLRIRCSRFQIGRATLCAVFSICNLQSAIVNLQAQETEPPKKPGVKLMFVPPPMEGAISLGIYDAKGKLVRTLHRETEVESDEFGKALNGLVTYWDGKNDAGAQMPAGKYFARGFMVGEINCEGEAFLFNDWITDENSPRVRSVHDLRMAPNDMLLIGAQTPTGKELSWYCDANGNVLGGALNKESAEVAGGWSARESRSVVAERGRVHLVDEGSPGEGRELPLPGVTWAIGACLSRDGNVWVVDCGEKCEVAEYSPDGKMLRRLAVQPGDPLPWQVAASKERDAIYLIESDLHKNIWRVRGLELAGEPQPVNKDELTTTWKTLFSKTVSVSDTLDAVRAKLKFPNGQPFVPLEKIKVDLQTNLLTPDQPASAEIGIGIDAKGSFLKTADGLELERVSETPNLRWAALGRPKDSRVVTIFQSDGAVVEEFKVRGLANMMAFDCGDFEYQPGK